MLNIQRFECNMFQENCYVVSDDTKECVIIDCGALHPEERKAMERYISDNGLTPKRLVCTHGHIDHNFGNRFAEDTYGLKPEVSTHDSQLIENLPAQASALIGMTYREEPSEVKNYFDEGEVIKFGNHALDVISTPGHSPGSVVLYSKDENVAFTGDTLFRLSIGRTDFQLGSYQDMMKSLKKLSSLLPADCIILPGHGEQTTMGFETAHNPYFK